MINPWKEFSADQAQQWQKSQLQGTEAFRLHLKRAALWDIIRTHLPDDLNSPIFDLGGGTGLWSIRLAAEGYAVTLTDISQGMLQQAAAAVAEADLESRITIEQVDVVDLSRYSENRFALALAVGAPLSYAGDAAASLREIFRVVQPGGVLIGDVENRYVGALFRRRASNWADAKQILLQGIGRWRDEGPAAPIQMFDPDEIRSLLQSQDWQLEAMYASDMVESLLHDDVITEIAALPALFRDILHVEFHLRSQPCLLASGRDIQFVARKPA